MSKTIQRWSFFALFWLGQASSTIGLLTHAWPWVGLTTFLWFTALLVLVLWPENSELSKLIGSIHDKFN